MKKYVLFTLVTALLFSTFVPVMAREKTPLELAWEKVILNEDGQLFDNYEEFNSLRWSYLDVPTPEGCIQRLKDAGLYGQHPRILATKDDFSRIKEQMKTDAFTATLYRKQKEYGDNLITQPLHLFTEVTGSAPETAYSREIQDRMILLGMLYQMTGDKKYVEYAERQIDAALQGCIGWQETYALQNGEITVGIAIGYDWMYDALSDNIKDRIKDFILSRFKVNENNYNPGAGGYPNQTNNWNSVINGSYGTAALAIMDEDSSNLAAKIVVESAKSITLSMYEMSPNGGFPEGPGYWSYHVKWAQVFMSALDSALKTDFKLSEFPGFKETSFFPVYISGPTYVSFNYSDNNAGTLTTFHLYWFAKKYGFEGLNKLADDLSPSGTDFSQWEPKSIDTFIMLWRTPTDKDPYEGLPEGKVFYGENDAASLRSEWGNPYATFVGFKGGYAQNSHANLDAGTFVLDALGTRWVDDLGSEAYELEGYWDFDKGRWEIYSQRAEGHNTIAINLSKSADQDPYSKAYITDFKCEGDLKYGVIDLSDTYNAGAHSAIRGVALCGENVIIKDEIKLKDKSDVLWGINTTADVEISDNKKDAILTLQEKKMKVSIISPQEAEFETMPAKSLVFSKKEGEKNIDNYKRLYTRFVSSGDVDIAITFTPFYDDEPEPERVKSVSKIHKWSEGDIYVADELISKITVGGEVLDEFNSVKPGYIISLEEGSEVPQLKVEYDTVNSKIEVNQAENIGDIARITVQSLDPRQGKIDYSFKFEKKQEFGWPAHLEEIPIAEITASADEAKTPVPYVHDRRLDTSWAAQGEQWIMFDFGEVTPVKCVAMAFSRALQRRSVFDIEVSEDGEHFTQVFSGMSTGTTMGYELYSFNDVKARYVRINGHQNTVNSYNNYTEVSFFK